MFHFQFDAGTVAHLSRLLRQPQNKVFERQTLMDSCSEYANMICGAFNRGLGSEFRYTGMSTPFFLDSGCSEYVSSLKPNQLQSFSVAINDRMKFHLNVCICVEKGVTLDTKNLVHHNSPSGEIELF